MQTAWAVVRVYDNHEYMPHDRHVTRTVMAIAMTQESAKAHADSLTAAVKAAWERSLEEGRKEEEGLDHETFVLSELDREVGFHTLEMFASPNHYSYECVEVPLV